MTINQPATLMLATGAIVIGAFGAAAPAHAVDAYVALSYSLESKKSGMAVAATEDAAKTESLNNCVANGGNHCTPYVIAQNSCAALAIGTDPTLHQEWSTATNSILEMARKQALTNNGGGIIGASGCTTNLVVIRHPSRLTPGQLTRCRLQNRSLYPMITTTTACPNTTSSSTATPIRSSPTPTSTASTTETRSRTAPTH